jgi:hypothetical protein
VVSEANRLVKETLLKKSRFSESQIVAILKQHDASGKTAEICRRHGIHPNPCGTGRPSAAALKSATWSA